MFGKRGRHGAGASIVGQSAHHEQIEVIVRRLAAIAQRSPIRRFRLSPSSLSTTASSAPIASALRKRLLQRIGRHRKDGDGRIAARPLFELQRGFQSVLVVRIQYRLNAGTNEPLRLRIDTFFGIGIRDEFDRHHDLHVAERPP